MSFKKLTVLGAGSWGTALSQAFSKNFSQVIIWGRSKRIINEINSLKKNSKYLPEIRLSENIVGCTQINEAVKECDILIVAVPTQSVREVLSSINSEISVPVISASKGIEINSLKLISDIIKEVLNIQDDLIFALSGPSFAKEVALGLPTAVTLAGNIKIGEKLQEKLNTETFRLYITDDIIGAEIGGAVKNVIAIATGASDGLGLGNNARASLITRGLFEMTKVAKAFGGKPETLYGLAGLGDLVLTATGELSRNRRFGILLGKGYSVEEALKEVGQVVEGVKTVEALKKIQEKFSIELPISEVVYQVVYEGLSPREAVRILMSRQPKKEGF
ncbi:NAD(P)H-dependent glycerol-3-phosphate dehydrogenase [Persephonella sp.]